MTLRDRIKRAWAHRPHPLGFLWDWARKYGPKSRYHRWRALKNWAADMAKWQRSQHHYRKARMWAARKTIYRRKMRRAKRRMERTGNTNWESWMNNGCPTNTTNSVKAEIAAAVVKYDLAVTATTNGTHTSTSLHYPWNNSDNLGHAVDLAGSRMSEYQSARVLNSPGASHYQEFFGPQDSVCAKNGTRITISGALAYQHDNHDHDAPYGS